MNYQDICQPGEHDLSLPDWGPYSKRTSGIAHVADKTTGLRFDVGVFPGLFRRRVDPAMARYESGWYPWDGDGNLAWWSVRHDLGGKENFFSEFTWVQRPGEGGARLRARFVNGTAKPQNAVLHFFACLQSPTKGHTRVALHGATWCHALNHLSHTRGTARHDDALVPDGWRRDEVRGGEWVGDNALGRHFGEKPGDTTRYNIPLPEGEGPIWLTVRARLKTEAAVFRLDGGVHGEFHMSGANALPLSPGDDPSGPRTWATELGALPQKDLTFDWVALEGRAEINGFVVGRKNSKIQFIYEPFAFAPAVVEDENQLLLKWPGSEKSYLLAWKPHPRDVREFFMSDFSTFLRDKTHDHVTKIFRGDGPGHETNVCLSPIPLAPGQTLDLYACVAAGNEGALLETARQFAADETPGAAFAVADQQADEKRFLPGGEKTAFGTKRLAATVLQNVVFPIHTCGQHIRHHTPGRWWDSLYTWDSGFIGLGLLELDPRRAAENLRAYVTEVGDKEKAFVHHGSPVPVQIWLYHELWNRTGDRHLLAHFYPRLLRYYRFLCGQEPGSTTNPFQTDLLATWDYFYNSGGWDDYPAQWHLHQNHDRRRQVAPTVTTAHCARSARILAGAARLLGKTDDALALEQDHRRFTDALNTHAWDGETGYYSYVEHDAKGRALGPFRHESGANYNMGLDGASPLVTGALPKDRADLLVAHLMNPKELWTPVGLGTVDQSSPYYNPRGYWNGTVWFPHQWFMFKAMLDLGRHREALLIADTALSVWEEELRDSWNCFEHFLVASKRGAGWHHFGGLSSPILAFEGARHKKERVTGGADYRRLEEVWGDGLDLRFETDGNSGEPFTLLVNTKGPFAGKVTLDGKPVAPSSNDGGRLVLNLNRAPGPRHLVVAV